MLATHQHKFIRNLCIIIICACILAATTFVDWNIIVDRIRGSSFEPTAEMAKLKDDLNLTSRASIILAATHPTIKDREEFNRACTSSNSTVAILGCYDGQYIYIYNIDNAELAGIKQSTLAHELLHAAWDRMSTPDRTKLEPDLESIYKANLAVFQDCGEPIWE